MILYRISKNIIMLHLEKKYSSIYLKLMMECLNDIFEDIFIQLLNKHAPQKMNVCD